MLIPQLIPQRMERLVMRPMHVMTQLVQHGVDDVLEREELALIGRRAEPEADLLAAVDVQAEQVGFGGVELAEDVDAPVALPHQRFDE